MLVFVRPAGVQAPRTWRAVSGLQENAILQVVTAKSNANLEVWRGGMIIVNVL